MNIDSYTRLNPYYEDEKDQTADQKGDNTAIIALGVVVALGIIFVLAWSRT